MMSRSLLVLAVALALGAAAVGAHPRRPIRTREEADLARGVRLLNCGQWYGSRRALERARRHGDAVVVQEATWALQELGIDRRSVAVYVEDRVREAKDAGEELDADER